MLLKMLPIETLGRAYNIGVDDIGSMHVSYPPMISLNIRGYAVETSPFHGRGLLIELCPVLSTLLLMDPTSYGVDESRLQATQVCIRRSFIIIVL